jgi:methylated-DNA-protein-cysteine methyltransferase-like protein
VGEIKGEIRTTPLAEVVGKQKSLDPWLVKLAGSWPSKRSMVRRVRPGGRRPPQTREGGFFALVYALVRQIPRGKAATYGQIARLLGAPRAARVVGWAMHDNPHGSRVPCHRVVQQGGSLSPNYCLDDPGRQRRLLEQEGVAFLLNGRVDMARHQWSPPVTGVR